MSCSVLIAGFYQRPELTMCDKVSTAHGRCTACISVATFLYFCPFFCAFFSTSRPGPCFE